jgi:hypothetical protein
MDGTAAVLEVRTAIAHKLCRSFGDLKRFQMVQTMLARFKPFEIRIEKLIERRADQLQLLAKSLTATV